MSAAFFSAEDRAKRKHTHFPHVKELFEIYKYCEIKLLEDPEDPDPCAGGGFCPPPPPPVPCTGETDPELPVVSHKIKNK